MTVWYAVMDFVEALIRPGKVRRDWERAFRPAGVLKRALVIFGGRLLIGWVRNRGAELHAPRVPSSPGDSV